jgi:hypothetical protein
MLGENLEEQNPEELFFSRRADTRQFEWSLVSDANLAAVVDI